jgi:TonB family protein
MVAVADRLFPPGPRPREVWLTFGLSVLFHGLLTAAIVMVPRFQVGTYIKVPVSYTVSLVEAPPGGQGGGSPAPPPVTLRPPAPPQVAPAPAVRPAPHPAPRPAEELTLPGRRPAPKPAQERERSLRPPVVTGKEAAKPAPPSPVPVMPVAPAVPQPVMPVAPAVPQPVMPVAPAVPQRVTPVVAPPVVAPPAASAGPGAGVGPEKASGVEVAGTGTGVGSGAGPGAGGGSALASYLTLVDWKIQQNWVPVGTPGLPETVVVVRFRVLPSGQVRDLELEATSGNAGLDASALRAVRQSLPLPPFPNLLTEPSLDLRYRFVMERG